MGHWPRGHSGNPRGIYFDGADGGESANGVGAVGSEATDGAQGDGDSEDSQPRFTQKQLDEVVGRRLEQERRKWDRDFKQKLDEALKARAAESQSQSSAAESKDRPKGKDEGTIPRSEYDHLKSQLEKAHKEALTEKDQIIAQKDKQIEVLLDEKRHTAIIAAVAPLSPVNAKQIAKLVNDQVGFDEDGGIVVLSASGQPRYGKDGNYMTVDEFMVEFAKANPHLFKAEVTTGSGSRGGAAPGGNKQNLSTSTAKIAAGLARLRTASG